MPKVVRPGTAGVVVVAALVAAMALPSVQAAPKSTPVVVATVGQAQEVRCPTGQLAIVFQTGPLWWQCNAKTGPTTTTTTTTTPSPPNGTTPASAMPASLFNQRVTGWGVLPSSAQFAADFVADYKANFGSVGVNTAPMFPCPITQARER